MTPIDSESSGLIPGRPPSPVESKVSPKVERPERRTFTADYKRRILKEADEGPVGSTGALLRREGLYSSHLTTWREQRTRGELAGVAAVKRGPKPDPYAAERAALQGEIAQLKADLEQARLIIDVQKKVSQLLGLLPLYNATPTCETGDEG